MLVPQVEAGERTPSVRTLDRARAAGPPADGSPAAGAPARPAALTWRAWQRRYHAAMIALDAVTAAAAVLLLLGGAYGAGVRLAAAAATAGVLVLLVWLHGGYSREHTNAGPAEFRALFRAGTLTGLVTMAVAYLVGLDVPRLLPLLTLPAAVGVMALVRAHSRVHVRRARRRGRLLRPTLVAGDSGAVGALLTALREERGYGLVPVGLCVPGPIDAAASQGVPVLGSLEHLPQLAAEAGAEVLIVDSGSYSTAELRHLTWLLEGSGVEFMLAPNLFEVGATRVTMQPVAGSTLLSVSIGASRRRLRTKALFDRVVGALCLLLALPVIAGCAVAVRLTSPGPAFFRQTRVGTDGAEFTMVKLRTMSRDAGAQLAELAAHNQGNGVLFKMHQDPRVTPLGRLLRRYSLDELPQLWNVVRGDMSLVGPRPPLPQETERYDGTERRRLKVKPGLTGLWQVSGRSDLSWEDSVRLDLRYVDNWSPSMDLAILGRTVGAVFGGRGAY